MGYLARNVMTLERCKQVQRGVGYFISAENHLPIVRRACSGYIHKAVLCNRQVHASA